VTFDLHLTAGGGYSVTLPVRFTILPTYGDHNVGNVVMTITNFGAIGYVPYVLGPTTPPVGSGFQYPAGSASGLYHGSVMVGASPTRVSDNSYGNSTYDRYDFSTVPGGDLVIQPGTQADQEGFAMYADRQSDPAVGVQITQHSYAWAAAPNNDYVIVRFDVANRTDSTLHGVYVAVYLDWDIGTSNQNSCGWNADSAVGYMRGGTSPYYGLCLVSGPAASYRAVYNPTYVYGNLFTDAIKYQFMTEGFVVVQSTAPNDWSMQLTAGPFDIASGEYQGVAFAFLGADNLADLQANVGAARAKYNSLFLGISPEIPPVVPKDYTLLEPAPNPFNPSTAVEYQLPVAGHVNLRVYDTSGRRVATLVDGWQTAGSHQVTFYGSGLTSGLYFVKMQAANFSQVRKVVLLK
jgi:hypothetical protein